MGDLEPSSNQAGSGEQFKRKKSMSVGGPLFHKQVFAEHSECRWEGVVSEPDSGYRLVGSLERGSFGSRPA